MNFRAKALALALGIAGVCAGCVPDDHSGANFKLSPTPTLYQAALPAGHFDWHTVEMVGQNDGRPVGLRNPNSSASGHFNTNGGHTITVSVMQNNGGVHGQGHLSGPIYVEMDLDMVCVEVDGNRATVAGEITALDLGENPFGLPIDVGWLFYLAVEDNGEGANAPPDRHHSFVYFGMPGFGIFCNILNPNIEQFWPEAFWFDIVGPGGQIQVK